ncbi:DUF2231 domain-containing protein [Rosettibacter firmus]|uniref:DUF2231 domain-containing protein n=1 Tax=Rosettibacter firmus TaxID=3111522 RepID=UPI00336BC12A
MELLSNFHPKVVHFSISLFVIYFVFDLSGFVFKKEYLQKSAFVLLIIGVISSILSVLSGHQAFETFKNNFQNNLSMYYDLIELHEDYATITVWYFSALLLLRIYLSLKKKLTKKYQIVFLLFSFIGVILILMTAYYGGELVFEYGIGTKLFGK